MKIKNVEEGNWQHSWFLRKIVLRDHNLFVLPMPSLSLNTKKKLHSLSLFRPLDQSLSASEDLYSIGNQCPRLTLPYQNSLPKNKPKIPYERRVEYTHSILISNIDTSSSYMLQHRKVKELLISATIERNLDQKQDCLIHPKTQGRKWSDQAQRDPPKQSCW